MTKEHKIGIVVDGIVFELPKAVMCPEHTLCDECILNQSYLRAAIYRLDHPRYYQDNKDVILFKRKWKYKTDPAYRQQCIERVKRYKTKKKVCQILRILGDLVSHKEALSSINTIK